MLSLESSIDLLEFNIQSHVGMVALNDFGSTLIKKTLCREELKVFFSSLWGFYQQTPSGIVSLALRVNDYWSNEISPWTAMENAALLLSASIDEFGLDKFSDRVLPTHHNLFLQAAKYYQVGVGDLLSNKYILPAGAQIGRDSFEYYRNKPIAEALGFHFASELTSFREFKCFFEGFSTHKNHYHLYDNSNPGLYFFWVHTLIEPAHLVASKKIIRAFLNVKPEMIDMVICGAMHYMQSYYKLFDELKTALG